MSNDEIVDELKDVLSHLAEVIGVLEEKKIIREREHVVLYEKFKNYQERALKEQQD